jgi:chemotaxis protein methyltransferase CheR
MTWTHSAYEAVSRLVAAHTGLHFPPGREDRAELAISRAMARAHVTSPEESRDLLERDEAALDDLVGELTVGETYFFREPAQFAFLRRQALPELRRCRGPDHVFRVWSAGCASGEEAYSLAILFEQEGLGERVHLLATDISRDALARARQAAYTDWSLRGPSAAAVVPFLTRRGNLHVLDERIRGRVRFEYLNLARDVYPSFATGTWGQDLILCRNVLIYLDRATAETVAGRLFRSLAPGDGGPRPSAHPTAPAAVTVDAPDEREDITEKVRKLAGENVAEAERECAAALAGRPLDAELRYLHAVLLTDLGRDGEAVGELRKVVYLDRSLAVAHFTLGSLLWRRGDRGGARAAYRNTLALCAARPADEALPLGDGECAGRLARAAAFQLEVLEGGGGATS